MPANLDEMSSQFRSFIGRSKELLTSDLPKKLTAILPTLKQVRSWLLDPSHDLLHIANVTYDENAYTKLMAYSLRPVTHPATQVERQRAWLTTLPFPEATCLDSAAEPQPFLHTDDGIPDLVLRYPHFVVVIEAKTRSEEHLTPRTGRPQSVAYPEAVRRKFSLDPSVPIYMIFVTPCGSAPANPEAIPTTYRNFALALAIGLSPAHLTEELRPSFKLLITHLFIQTGSAGMELWKTLDEMIPVLADFKTEEIKSRLLDNLAGINQFLSLLEKGRSTNE